MRRIASLVAGVGAITGYAATAAGAQPYPNLHLSVAQAESALNGLVRLHFRTVRGGGAYVATSKTIITIFEVWGREKATKIEAETFYGADSHNATQLGLQVAGESYVCFLFGTNAVYRWCKAAITQTAATNTSRSLTATIVMDQGAYRMPYRFVVAGQRNSLEPVSVTITPG